VKYIDFVAPAVQLYLYSMILAYQTARQLDRITLGLLSIFLVRVD